MGKGRYLKSAEAACATKARYDSPLEAERSCDWRFRAYQCPVCHHWHLTRQPGTVTPREGPPPPPGPPSGPRLGDLDWSPALKPQPRVKPPRPEKPAKPRYTPPAPEVEVIAKCLGKVRKDGRVYALVDGVPVKTQPVRDPLLAKQIAAGVWVALSGESPPRVRRVVSLA